MSRDPVLVRMLVAAYPAAWRRRYGDEYGQLLLDAFRAEPWLRRPAVLGNVLRGVLDARLQSVGGVNMSRRSPLSVAVWATGLFCVAGIGFEKLSEDSFPTGPPRLVGAAFDALVISAVVALVSIVVTAVPTALAMIRGRTKGKTKGAVLLLAVPPVAFGLWYGLLRATMVVARDRPVHSVQNIAAAAVVIGGGVGVIAATAWAAAVVLRRVGAAPARWQKVPAVALTVGMGAGTVACLVWGLALHAADATAFTANDGILATPLLPSWILTVVLMGGATVLAGSAIGQTPTAPTTA